MAEPSLTGLLQQLVIQEKKETDLMLEENTNTIFCFLPLFTNWLKSWGFILQCSRALVSNFNHRLFFHSRSLAKQMLIKQHDYCVGVFQIGQNERDGSNMCSSSGTHQIFSDLEDACRRLPAAGTSSRAAAINSVVLFGELGRAATCPSSCKAGVNRSSPGPPHLACPSAAASPGTSSSNSRGNTWFAETKNFFVFIVIAVQSLRGQQPQTCLEDQCSANTVVYSNQTIKY